MANKINYIISPEQAADPTSKFFQRMPEIGGTTWGATNPDTGKPWGWKPPAKKQTFGYNITQATDIGNPFEDYLPQEFLETSPSAAYYSSPGAAEFYTRPSGQVDPTRKKFYQESFQDIYNEYLGKLGGMAREGEIPDLRFSDYLSSADPFKERFERLTPYQRGQSTRAFAPSTRFIYY